MARETPPCSDTRESPSERGRSDAPSTMSIGAPGPSVRADVGYNRDFDRDRETVDESDSPRPLPALPIPAVRHPTARRVRLRNEAATDEPNDGIVDREAGRPVPQCPVDEATDADVRRAIEALE